MSLEDVKGAVKRARRLALQNEKDGKKIVKHSGYSYYPENPSLSINKVVERILTECKMM